MISYNVLIDKELPGNAPQEKYDNLMAMKNILLMAAYPRRGADDGLELIDIAVMIQQKFKLEELCIQEQQRNE